VPGYDRAACAELIGRALALPGGADLVVGSLSGLPGAVAIGARPGRFRSRAGFVELGQWRYAVAASGRLAVAHVVAGIVLAEETLPAATAGDHVAGALGQHLAELGPRGLAEVLSVLEGLSAASA
jgi:hypothetical protein